MLHSLFKSMSLVMFMRVGGIALQLLWFVILVRLLPLEAVGVYSVINSIWLLVRALGPAGYDTAFIREGGSLVAKQDFAQARSLLSFGMCRALLLNTALYIGALFAIKKLFPFFFYTSPIDPFIWIMLGSYAYLLFGFCSAAMLTLEKQISAHALESIILPLSVIAGALLLTQAGEFSLGHLIALQTFIALIVAIIYYVLVFIHYGGKTTSLSRERKKEFRHLARSLFGTLAFNNLNVRLPVVISPLLIGTAGTALLEAAIRFASLLGVIQWCAAFVISPKLSKVDSDKEPATLQNLLVIGCWLVFIPSLSLFLVLSFAGDHLLQLIAGPAYIEAYLPMVILALGYLINTSSGPTTHFYMMLGHEKTAFKISAFETVITLTLLITLSWWMGLYGMVAGMTLGLAFRNFWLNWQLKPLTGLYSGVWSFKGWQHAMKVMRGHA